MFSIFRKPAALAVIGSIMALCLFAQSSAIPAKNILALVFTKASDLFLGAKTQWLTYGLLIFYFAILMLVKFRLSNLRFWRLKNRDLYLSICVSITAVSYVVNYQDSNNPPSAIIFIAAIVFGRLISILVLWKDGSEKDKAHSGLIMTLIASLLWAALCNHSNKAELFSYHGNQRWSGPWISPNIFGMLMGVGTVLSIGLAIIKFNLNDRVSNYENTRGSRKRYIFPVLFSVTAIILSQSLLYSYSRGSWLGTICALTYLIIIQTFLNESSDAYLSSIKSQKEASAINKFFWGSPILKGWLTMVLVFLFICTLIFWIRHSNSETLVERVVSISNVNDFSWRNRIAAWEGALQIMAEHPAFGVGWNQPEPLYGHYYLSPKLNDGAAVEMNDYFILGATLGVPALACFAIFIWLSFIRSSNIGTSEAKCSATICRAGTIVLAVGFWFDGGLFKLSTALVFWTLLELGQQDLRIGEANEPVIK